MSKFTYEDYVEAAKAQGFEIELSEEDFSELSEEQLDELSVKTASQALSNLNANRGEGHYSGKRAERSNRQQKTFNKYLDKKMPGRGSAHNDKYGEEVEMSDENQIEEGSQAMDTLKPNSMPASDPKSRVEIMKSMIGAMAEMPKRDLVKWFDQTQALYGPGKDWGVGDKSASNKASVSMKASAAGGKGADVKDPMPKLSVKEDVEEMFNGQELSEEFKEKASTIFEAAVSARIIAETARLEEEYETKLNEEIESVTTALTEKLDTYLDYVVENWMKENEVAIETSLRNELVDDFIESLKGVFAEHYIDVPQDKLDVLESLAAKVEELESRLDETISENVELRKIATAVEQEDVFNSVSEGLALTQVERFRSLAEGIEFDGNTAAYERKLNTIKETYFTNKQASPASMITEESGEDIVEEVNVSPEMKRYMSAISRSLKK